MMVARFPFGWRQRESCSRVRRFGSVLGCTSPHSADVERGCFAICLMAGWLSHVRTCHFGGSRRWPACAARLAAVLGSDGELHLQRLPAPRQIFDCTTLHPADDEHGRVAICRTIPCLSHVRTCHFGSLDAGRDVLHAWQWLLALAESCAITDCALRLVFDFTTLHPADDERGRFAICRTIGWLSQVRTCHVEAYDAVRQPT
jgi:hypothetical protein